MESFASQTRAFLYSLAIHVALILVVWFGVDWLFPPSDANAAGEPVQATLKVSDKELQAARRAIEKAEKKVVEEAPKSQQVRPEPRPQDSPVPPQPKPQEQLARPDTVDQQAISRAAVEPPKVPAPQEQQQRQRQEQAELTEDIARQQEAERKQRLLAYQEVRQQREAAERRTKLEEQRLQQLADQQRDEPAPPRAAPARAETPPGNNGQDAGLLARYKAAMLQTADQNWNHLGAPELTTCKVRFTQLPGGDVSNVEFIRCPYDAEGREFVERALMKTPMPYSGFESVFMRQVELSFCYPREDCER
jgi:colicin import membrane protein